MADKPTKEPETPPAPDPEPEAPPAVAPEPETPPAPDPEPEAEEPGVKFTVVAGPSVMHLMVWECSVGPHSFMTPVTTDPPQACDLGHRAPLEAPVAE